MQNNYRQLDDNKKVMINKEIYSMGKKNLIITFWCQLGYIFVSFICRTVFTYVLGAEYLGINGLFSNVITILSFVELGLGNAMVYKLYKPIKDNDTNSIRIYISFYKHVYRIIMTIVFFVGLALAPFLDKLVSNSNVSTNIYLLYFLFLLDTVISYAYVFRKTIIIADQKNYIIESYTLSFNIAMNIIQMIIVAITHAYIPYLIVKIVFDLLCNAALDLRSVNDYPFLRNLDSNPKLSDEDKKEFYANIKGLFIEKMAAVSFSGTDNIFITMFYNVSMVGIVSQYTMILHAFNLLLTKVYGALTASIGKLNVEENSSFVENVFIKIYFTNALIYGLLFTGMANLLQVFVVDIWLNDDYFLGTIPILLMTAEVCIRGMHYPVFLVRSALGLFAQLRVVALFCAFLNIVLDFILGYFWGISGIIVATIVSRGIVYITDIFVVYKYGFKCSIKNFILIVLRCMINAVVIGWFAGYIIKLLPEFKGIIGFGLYIIISVIVFALLSWLFNIKQFNSILSDVRKEKD